jgi:hypothetical protein
VGKKSRALAPVGHFWHTGAMLFIAFAVAVLAVPFEDTQHRFSLNLPPQWAFAPQPGDTGGAAFRRATDGVMAHAMVRVMPFNQPVDLGAFFSRLGAAYTEEPGYRLLISEPTRMAGNPAQRRRFVSWVNGDPKLPKIAEQRVTIVDNVGFVVHVETMADAFAVFEADFDVLFASFVPGTGQAPIVVPGSRHRPDAREITGKWEAPGGAHALELSPGGIVILDGARGHYRLDHGTLVCDLGDAGEHMYDVEMGKGTLTLTGGSFAAGLQFKKLRHKPTARIKPPAQAVTPELATP